MQIRFFTVAVHGGQESAEALNQFLASNRVLSIDRSLVQDGASSAWAFSVHFDPPSTGRASPPVVMGQGGKKARVDYRETLNEQDFTVFAKLRTLRKELSDAEGVPAYALFTNEQLAEMVTGRVTTPKALQQIGGIGDARVAKYGEAFLKLLQEAASDRAAMGKSVHET